MEGLNRFLLPSRPHQNPVAQIRVSSLKRAGLGVWVAIMDHEGVFTADEDVFDRSASLFLVMKLLHQRTALGSRLSHLAFTHQ